MSKLSVYIIAFNEEDKIRNAVASVINWADEVIVADSFSKDRTAEIASSMGAKVVQIPFTGFGQLRNIAIESCSYPWIFSLDADERCTDAARKEIAAIIQADSKNGPTAYFVPRRNYMMGQWVRHSGYYPDYRQPQLFRKGALVYREDPVHELYDVDGEIGKMSSDIIQYPFKNLEQIMHKANRYSTLGAEKMKNTKKGSLTKAILHSAMAFVKSYFLKAGFLDGRAGITIAAYSGYYTFFKYLKLLEIQNNWGEPQAKDTVF
jgi:glycosyltransferase involved in cell wall biosynthesis